MAKTQTKSHTQLKVGDKGRRKVVKACTILNKTPEELFQFWRNLENLPRFSQHILSITTKTNKVSHWVVKGPRDKNVEWDSEIINEHPNELIAWRTIHDSGIENAGTIRFEPLQNWVAKGTVVKVALDYIPPAGKVGALVAKMTGEEPEMQVEDDLMRFKALMETGEIATIEGQPVGKEQQGKGKRK
jgi:uncharacterized membrane protein